MPELVDWSLDLAAHEQTRVAAVLTAVGDQLNLLDMYHNECDATRMLYSGLSLEQWKIYDQLVEAGVIGL